MKVSKEEYLKQFKELAIDGTRLNRYYLHRENIALNKAIIYIVYDSVIRGITVNIHQVNGTIEFMGDYLHHIGSAHHLINFGYHSHARVLLDSYNWRELVNKDIQVLINKLSSDIVMDLSGLDVCKGDLRKLDPDFIYWDFKFRNLRPLTHKITGTIFYFKDNKLTACRPDDDMLYKELTRGKVNLDDDATFVDGQKLKIRDKLIDSWDKLKGLTYDKLVSELEDACKKTKKPPVLQYTCKYNVRIERSVDNNKKGTFDFVKVDVSLTPHGKLNTYKKVCDAFRDDIVTCALDKISQSKRYIDKGVPINFLRLTSAKIMHDGILELIFELKELEN